MPEKYNPLKSAELSGEQNYNMIDGILNNAVAPLPQSPEKPVDLSLIHIYGDEGLYRPGQLRLPAIPDFPGGPVLGLSLIHI